MIKCLSFKCRFLMLTLDLRSPAFRLSAASAVLCPFSAKNNGGASSAPVTTKKDPADLALPERTSLKGLFAFCSPFLVFAWKPCAFARNQVTLRTFLLPPQCFFPFVLVRFSASQPTARLAKVREGREVLIGYLREVGVTKNLIEIQVQLPPLCLCLCFSFSV